MARWVVVAVIFALGAGVWQCVHLMWACDDAYITFRYARNLVEGHGLIYNPGAPDEVVEGYSNFSWTLAMAAGLGLGVGEGDLWRWAGWLGLGCHLGTALLLLRASRRLGRRLCLPPLPVAAIGLALHHHWASLAVGGLETALFTLLVTALAVELPGMAAAPRPARRAALLGLIAAAACLTRPDGALPALVVGLVLVGALLRRRPGARRNLLAYALTAAALLVPHLLWRRAYYGEWVPNTAFAKSAAEPYPGRGLAYVGWYFAVYWVLALGLLGLVWGAVRERLAVAAVALAIALPYLGFVVWVGGDFMFGRFLLPITPVLYLGLETALPRWRGTGADLLRVGLVAAATVVIFPPAWLGDYTNPYGFSDNREISVAPLFDGQSVSRLDASLAAGEMTRTLTDGLDVRVALHGGHANLAYTGRFPVAIETAAGLTDPFIARLPTVRRGMVGHERHFRQFRGYLEQRGVLLNFHLAWRGGNAVDQLTGVDGRPMRFIELLHPDHPGAVLPAILVTYQKDLLDEMLARSPGCNFVRFDQWLDDVYLPGLAQRPIPKVKRELEAFDLYYFDHNRDPDRRRPIAARAGH